MRVVQHPGRIPFMGAQQTAYDSAKAVSDLGMEAAQLHTTATRCCSNGKVGCDCAI